MPVSRPLAKLMVAKSKGKPNKLFRKDSVTNSSISLPTCLTIPAAMAPAAMFGVAPLATNSKGFKKAWIKPISLVVPSALVLPIMSVNIVWPKR